MKNRVPNILPSKTIVTGPSNSNTIMITLKYSSELQSVYLLSIIIIIIVLP